MKKIAITITAAILTCSAVAQDFNRIEFSINAGGGMSNFQTRQTNGKDLWNWTGTAGWGFHFFFNPHWGIGTGVNYSIYNTGISINEYYKEQSTINMLTGNPFVFRVRSLDYQENQQSRLVTIPLMIQYQGAGKTAFYASLGGKAGVPVTSKGNPKGRFTTQGYYENMNVTYEDLPQFGFVTNQPFPDRQNDIRLKPAYLASAELGVKWRLGKVVSLYTGLYVDYGLNDILNKEVANNANAVVFQPATPAQFAYNTAIYSNSKQVKPLAGGITLRLAFGFKKTVCPVCQPCPDCPPCPPQDKKNKTSKPDQECQEADSIIKSLDAQLLAAEAEALRLAQQLATYDLEKPIINYVLSQTEAANMQKHELDEKVEILLKYPDIKFYINGHTCTYGTSEINEKIGLARAKSAKEYLISKGIDESRILGIYSKRDTEPIVPNSSEGNRRINRRVQLIVQK